MQRSLILATVLAAAPLAAQQTGPIVLWGEFTTASTAAEI